MESKIGYYWHNFRTGEEEYRIDEPTDFSDYVHPTTLELYQLMVKWGIKPADACIMVLDLYLGSRGGK